MPSTTNASHHKNSMPAKSANTEQTLQKADEICTQSGNRLTTKRAAILELLIDAERPLSAYDLVALYNQKQPQPIQPMSAYRILQFLQSEKLVHKLETQNKYIACTHITCSHPHAAPQFLVCKQCHRVKEIYLPEELIDALAGYAQQSGFSIDQTQIEFDGICEDCR